MVVFGHRVQVRNLRVSGLTVIAHMTCGEQSSPQLRLSSDLNMGVMAAQPRGMAQKDICHQEPDGSDAASLSLSTDAAAQCGE